MSKAIGVAYLDISPRQTGKTARLVEHACRVIFEGHNVCYVVQSKRLKTDIQSRIPAALVLIDGEPFPPGLNPSEYTWFYDEFDWMKSVTIKQGGYYATTARFARPLGVDDPDDILLCLINAAGGSYQRFTWPFDMADGIREARSSYTPEQFRNLFLGEVFQ